VRVLTALADDTRRQAFELLADRPMAVGELAEHLPVSRPAVSQHLRVLKEAGLVDEFRDGTRRVYSINPGGAEPLRDYLDRFWNLALARFAAEAERRATDTAPAQKNQVPRRKRRT
jgi:DNA-binding transcriptional ArsR family regulator